MPPQERWFIDQTHTSTNPKPQQPHLNEWVNHTRSGLYLSLFWVSVFMAVMKFDHRRVSERQGVVM